MTIERQTAQSTQAKPAPAGGILQRTCACGQHTGAGGECEACRKKRTGMLQRAAISAPPIGQAPSIVQETLRSPGQPLNTATRAFMEPRFGHDFSQIPTQGPTGRALQTKLAINTPGDEYEQEADHIADQVLAEPAHPDVSSAPPHIQRFVGPATSAVDTAPASVDRVLASAGQPLNPALQRDMGQRFGHDFSRVRVHSSAAAEQSARDVNALAYTVGHNIVFGTGQFTPNTQQGRRLLAHELTHVVQQSGADQARITQGDEEHSLSRISCIQPQGSGTIRRCVNPSKNDPLYDGLVTAIKATAAYKALADKTLADSIITDAKKKPACIYYAGKLKQLFDTSEKAPAIISTETKASTVQETAKEQARVAKPAEAKNLDVEEKASANIDKVGVKIKGKFGGGTYQVDRTDPKNIVVKAKIFLKPTGSGTVDDVKNIKKMEDAIEKAASMKGFTVDIEFVNVPDAETFTAQVDPNRWEDAENWSGGNPTGFGHELLHMFAFELDRYNYIESHSTNRSMTVPNRLIWFAKQLTKPAGFDNPLSIMGYGEHPLDDDACRVAGLDIATCIAARQKPAKP